MAMAAVIGLGAMSAISQLNQGKAQAASAKRVGEYNAQVYEQQAEMIAQKKKLEEFQYNRKISQTNAAVMARSAGKGFGISGSPLAVMVDNETQLQLDKSIGQYNLEVERRYATSSAANARYAGSEQARLAKMTGYSNAFSTILGTMASASSMGKGKGV
jgi:hypothetical protein